VKVCSKCNNSKDDDRFPFKNKSENKRSSVCKECQREYKNKHYSLNKESHYKRNKATTAKLRSYANSVKHTGCVVCGENDVCCLDFHHTKDKTKEVAVIVNLGSMIKLKSEVEKCVVLCSNCHRKLHAGRFKLQ